jgi:hypothetical protein
MTMIGQARLSATRTVDFYDSDRGVVLRETGRIEEAKERRLDLDGLRRLGMTEMYRTLVADPNADAPAALVAAGERWAARASFETSAPGDLLPKPASLARASVGLGARWSDGNDIGSTTEALSGDAAWWQSLSLCQSVESTGSFTGPAWYDGVWCPVDVTWALTDFRGTMYYEATALGEDGVASVHIAKWINDDWQWIVSQDVPYRWYQTFSFPPENWAFYQTWVTGELDSNGNSTTNIGLSERFRLAMPTPVKSNFVPDQAQYSFSNDIDGITHDADNIYMTRSEFGLSTIPSKGQISKTPIGGSLARQPPFVVDMPKAWKFWDPSCNNSCLFRYNHFGDLVHVDGRLYVAMEGPAGGAVGVFDTDLHPIGFAELSTTEHSCPWIAHNPRNGLFYTPFSSSSDLALFTIDVWGNNVTAARQGTLHLSANIANQGAKFSPRGNLWVSSGYGGSSSLMLFGIDSVNGTVHFASHIDPHGADEGEGLDIFDADVDQRNPGMTGQLHVMVLENKDLVKDKFSLEHFRADMGSL